jgi:hypothetical protein
MSQENPVARIRACADYSIRRGLFFAALAVTTTLVGLAYDIGLALHAGAILSTLVWVVMLMKTFNAPRRNYKQTETWLLLDKRHDLPEGRAQAVIGQQLRDRYAWHANVCAGFAVSFWFFYFLWIMLT